ncbi:MAG: hypothetical protein K6E76_05275 [Patescibacteria group bacterium]|nr:hypothetical protein [Patescibacteria group bacterium]
MVAPEPEFILHSYFYDHQYIKFSRTFYLVEAFYKENANRNSSLESF